MEFYVQKDSLLRDVVGIVTFKADSTIAPLVDAREMFIVYQS